MNINKALFTFIKIAFSIMVILLVIYGAVQMCHIGYDYGYRLFTEPAMEEAPGEDVLVQVKEGMSNREIAEMLEKKGLVRDSNLFYIQLRMSAYAKKIKPGVYTLNTSMKPKELMAGMVPQEVEEDTEEAKPKESDTSESGTEEDTEEAEPKE